MWDRQSAGFSLASAVQRTWDEESPITIIGHSHGGNVAIEAANILAERGIEVNLLLTFQTPVMNEHQLNRENVSRHVHFYGALDPVQWLGGLGVSKATRTFEGAENHQYLRLSAHITGYNSILFWKDHVEKILFKEHLLH